MRSWSAENPVVSDEVSLYDVTKVMQLALNALGAAVPILS